jgi:hypothetical protein
VTSIDLLLRPGRAANRPMLHTSLIVEILRSQPTLTFWTASLAQAALWWLVPSLFYSSPPGDVPLVLAIGHEYQLGSFYGPPLAFWLADLAFALAGSIGVYFLAQACVVLTYYAVFTLGRAVVGVHHAAFAVLLMVGISAFTAPTPNRQHGGRCGAVSTSHLARPVRHRISFVAAVRSQLDGRVG